MNERTMKGRIFETLIKYHLHKHGYNVIPHNIQNYYNVDRQHHGLVVKGRGAWHQIDALGQFKFQIPFVYPIRLLAEAKYRNLTRNQKSIGINIVRDFVGVIKDISENYIVDNIQELRYKKSFRFTDAGAIFATLPFTEEAQMYAYAHGIYLIPCSNLREIVNNIFIQVRDNEQQKRRFLDQENRINERQALEEQEEYGHTYFGTVMGLYPIVIVSQTKIPEHLFQNNDNIPVRIHYNYFEAENQRALKYFRVSFNGWQGVFELPEYLFMEHFRSQNFQEEMINFKGNQLNYIDIPLIIDNIRRIIRLELDMNWLNDVQQSLRQRRLR